MGPEGQDWKSSVSRYLLTKVVIDGFSFGSRHNEILQRHGVTRSLSRQPPGDMSKKDAIVHATHRYHIYYGGLRCSQPKSKIRLRLWVADNLTLQPALHNCCSEIQRLL